MRRRYRLPLARWGLGVSLLIPAEHVQAAGPPVPPPNTPPALNRCDEAAGLKAVLMRELCTIQPFVWTY